tara:strand:+ start:1616 stop:2362 length:747 start_codon:yes stop_codon:yes gene_type:complete
MSLNKETGRFECDECDATFKTRAGLWKHKKNKHPKESLPVEENASNITDDKREPQTKGEPVSSSFSDASTGEDTKTEWLDFDFGEPNDKTDVIPTTLKGIAKPINQTKSKMTKAQRESFKKQNTAILKMGLTTIDSILTAYGKKATQNDDFLVSHSESDKDLVANAQYAYLEEKDLFLTNYLSTGLIAGTLTTWYIGSPIMRIRKQSTGKKVVGNIFKKLPLFGRLFRRKPKPQTEIGQIVEVEEDAE